VARVGRLLPEGVGEQPKVDHGAGGRTVGAFHKLGLGPIS
jgi:hypothetical protein